MKTDASPGPAVHGSTGVDCVERVGSERKARGVTSHKLWWSDALRNTPSSSFLKHGRREVTSNYSRIAEKVLEIR